MRTETQNAFDADRIVADMGVQAVVRLESLGIDSALAVDESGQTSQEEHLTWILTATDSQITEWAQDCKR